MNTRIWDDPDFMARRLAARERISEQLGLGEGLEERPTWFEAVYELADGDPAAVPWADLQPKAALLRWLEGLPASGARGQAIDVACGLGDNAEALAQAGFAVTAFDLSPRAIEWARRRFPETSVNYVAADLFDYPRSWARAFNLVHETYTIQALGGELRRKAIQRIALLVAPRGRLLVLCRGRDDDAPADGPPWPLSPSELKQFEEEGLEQTRFEDFEDQRDRPIRHFLAEYVRP